MPGLMEPSLYLKRCNSRRSCSSNSIERRYNIDMELIVQTKKQPKVILFSTPTCSWCRRVKTYFRENRVRFKDIDVSRDQRAAKDIIRMTGQMGVPVVLINNKPVVGFDKPKIDRMLGLNRAA